MAIKIGCQDGKNFWEGIRGLGMIELNDEKVLKIIFSACFILVNFSGCHSKSAYPIYKVYIYKNQLASNINNK